MKIESEKKLLKSALECAKRVGIYNKCCLGFGTALGAVRPTIRTNEKPPRYYRGLMLHDHDSDLCFLNLTRGEKEAYFKACKNAGLFEWRKPHTPAGRQARKPNGELLWFSMVEPKKRARCCNWFCFDFQGWMWHTKGKRWLEKFDSKKFRFDKDYAAILKGTPAKLYNGLTEINFEGMRVNIPTKIGALLDIWYKGWATPKRGGASRKNIVCVIKNWDNPKTWKVMCG